MPPSLSRSHGSVPSRTAATRAATAPGAPRSGLRIMVAGADRDTRAPVEAAVRRAFAGREAETWSVSLVRVATLWSVTLDGPGESFRNVSFTAEERRLAEAVAEVIRGGGTDAGSAASAATATAAPSRALVQERHTCARCQQGILVSYEAQPDEAKETAPVACPHCWAVSHVPVGGWAAAGGDYRAEKA